MKFSYPGTLIIYVVNFQYYCKVGTCLPQNCFLMSFNIHTPSLHQAKHIACWFYYYNSSRFELSLLTFFCDVAQDWQKDSRTYRVIQILCAASDGCRSWPWLTYSQVSGPSDCRYFQILTVIWVHFPSGWSRASTYICKAKTLAFADCDYCYTLVL